MSRKPGKTLYAGTFVQCKDLNKLDIISAGAVGVDHHGQIQFFERHCHDLQSVLEKHGWDNCETVVRADEKQFFFPGFVDTHIHAPQYPNSGLFGSLTLLDWLKKYTYPREAELKDLNKARVVYTSCVSRTLSHGTTTAAYYATADKGSTNVLADICLSLGQRAFIGRCNMDRESPSYYRDSSAAAAIADTRATIAHMRSIDADGALICPVITPRFAVSCSSECLKLLGELHKKTKLPIQTHISETTHECDLVKKLFPGSKSYAEVYDESGLLTPKTILAHAIHLTQDECELIGRRGAKVSHCPVSNSAISSGMARVRWLLDTGVTVGLGTDVSGGYSPSVLEAARHACLISRLVALTGGEHAKLSATEVLYLATKGGAAVVGLEHKLGGFEVGMEWDAQLIELNRVRDHAGEDVVAVADLPVDIFGWESPEEKVEKWVFGGNERNTRSVWVKGRLVHQKP